MLRSADITISGPNTVSGRDEYMYKAQHHNSFDFAQTYINRHIAPFIIRFLIQIKYNIYINSGFFFTKMEMFIQSQSRSVSLSWQDVS